MGGCKHIGAAMYSLEELLHSRGKDSVTSGSCLWVKKPTSSTKALLLGSFRTRKMIKANWIIAFILLHAFRVMCIVFSCSPSTSFSRNHDTNLLYAACSYI